MKLSSISLFLTMLAAVAANAIADSEPVALFKRQSPDRRRQSVPPRPQGQSYWLPPPQGQPHTFSSDPSSHQIFNRAPQQSGSQHTSFHHQHPAQQPGSQHPSSYQVAPHHLAQEQHHQQAQPYLLQAHQDQPQLSREAHLHGSPTQQTHHVDFEFIVPNARKHYDHHTLAIARGDAAHSNQLAADCATLAKSLRIPNTRIGPYQSWESKIRQFEGEARRYRESESSANTSGVTEGEVNKVLLSRQRADKSRNETWQQIHTHRPDIRREDYEAS